MFAGIEHNLTRLVNVFVYQIMVHPHQVYEGYSDTFVS